MPALILIPPSEKKADGGNGPTEVATGAFAGLGPDRGALLAALARARGRRASRAFGLTGTALDEALSLAAGWGTAGLLPAAARYQGVLYDHLAPATLTRAARARAETSVVITSALWGFVGFADPIPAYRLALAGRPFGPSRPTVGAWWRPRLAAAVADRVASVTAAGGVVVDLLPGGYADLVGDARRAAARQADSVRWVRIRFEGGDGRSAPSFNAKARKGALVRHLVSRAAAIRDSRGTAAALTAFRFDADRVVGPVDLAPGLTDLVVRPS